MRCVNTGTGCLEFYPIGKDPGYAILSHRWEDEEVTYDDMQKGLAHCQTKKGYYKLRKACEQALEDGLDYVWIDTCCINKDSSHELAEAINSMFAWYAGAVVCYAFLSDVESGNSDKHLEESVWFTRGWTLQELLAPYDVEFYDASWTRLGTKRELADQVARASNIDAAYLKHEKDFFAAPLAWRMSWASRRQTARIEDRAYSLLGIFNINMTMNYGEGANAFIRLQIAIVERYPDDHTIFAWKLDTDEPAGLLAPSPRCFEQGYMILPLPVQDRAAQLKSRPIVTARDTSITLEMRTWDAGIHEAFLKCRIGSAYVKIYLRRVSRGNEYERVRKSPNKFDVQRQSFERDVIVTNFREKSSTAMSVPRLSRIVQSQVSVVTSESSKILDMERMGISLLEDVRPRAGTEVMGFQFSEICGLDLTSDSTKFEFMHRSQAEWDREINALTLSPGLLWDDGYLAHIEFSRSDCFITGIWFGLDFDYNPVCILGDFGGFKSDLWESFLRWTRRLRGRSISGDVERDKWGHNANHHRWDNDGSHDLRQKPRDILNNLRVMPTRRAVRPLGENPRMWLLKGDYIQGLNVAIAKRSGKKCIHVKIGKGVVKGRTMWVVEIGMFKTLRDVPWQPESS